MVLTVEPGIYIAKDYDKVAPEWRGIGVRIEDDILVTKDGPTTSRARFRRRWRIWSGLAPEDRDRVGDRSDHEPECSADDRCAEAPIEEEKVRLADHVLAIEDDRVSGSQPVREIDLRVDDERQDRGCSRSASRATPRVD